MGTLSPSSPTRPKRAGKICSYARSPVAPKNTIASEVAVSMPGHPLRAPSRASRSSTGASQTQRGPCPALSRSPVAPKNTIASEVAVSMPGHPLRAPSRASRSSTGASQTQRGPCPALSLFRQFDKDLVPPRAEGQAGLLCSQAHDDAIPVLEPQFARCGRGDCEAACALDIGAGELGDVLKLIDLARRLQRGQRAESNQRANQGERISPALKGQRAAPDARAGDEGLRHRHLARGLEAPDALRGRNPRRRRRTASR